MTKSVIFVAILSPILAYAYGPINVRGQRGKILQATL